MTKRAAATAFAIASLLTACSPAARNETAEAGEAIAADANATMREAVSDIDAASDKAFGAAENAIDSVGNSIDAATAQGKAKTSEALRDAADAIEGSGERSGEK
ncbi:MAG: hypothetical protein C0476_06095 [Sphingomonas sp.]|nr:hypothetical protein [Sphingomonas sp.]